METVEVFRGRHGDREALLGPFPGVRDGNTVAYEFELDDRFEPWPGRSLLERVFVLLDLGVSMSWPPWHYVTNRQGERFLGLEDDGADRGSWYVDLVSVEVDGDRYVFRDLFIDVIIPTDGRHCRMLDLDEFANEVEDGSLTVEEAVDGLRRWQRFLDAHLHEHRNPRAEWSDFPPARIGALAGLPAPLGPVVPIEG